MSWERESHLDPRSERPRAGLLWTPVGYLLGLLAMSPAPLLYYWMFAPVAALLVAGVCLLAGARWPRGHQMALGALAAAAFGVIGAAVFAVGIA